MAPSLRAFSEPWIRSWTASISTDRRQHMTSPKLTGSQNLILFSRGTYFSIMTLTSESSVFTMSQTFLTFKMLL